MFGFETEFPLNDYKLLLTFEGGRIYPSLLILFTFSHPYMVERILFWGQIFEMEILMNLQVLRSPESENHVFSRWLGFATVRMSVNSIIQKQSAAETLSLIL